MVTLFFFFFFSRLFCLKNIASDFFQAIIDQTTFLKKKGTKMTEESYFLYIFSYLQLGLTFQRHVHGRNLLV